MGFYLKNCSKSISLRLSIEMYSFLSSEARKLGVDVSTYIRYLISEDMIFSNTVQEDCIDAEL